ncbi:uncharacterized protein DNG_09617 [Cephalotrichum gorgonifer]|uniref:Uncharacterized protein n=1 Tax=Cephalotrichum gorgonifer TaxID=2041049 RepID=A0AAE8N806_9PEZI|nr:uncharacterized protein DNG_09617 [Cephalotrichum gorgonifer]
MEFVAEGSGAIDPSPEAQEASNAITIQPDDDEDGNEDDDTQLDDDDSTTCLEMIDRESRAETSDSECDTPVQLPGPPKRKPPPSSYNRRARVAQVGAWLLRMRMRYLLN